ncbi:MAG: hypothetical protein ACK595_12405 [Planctomycetota bacterium]|jgi:hypothetical protein
MRTTTLLGLCLAAAALPAQSFLALPATANPAAELGNFSLVPFMQPNARVQLFYDGVEVGSTAFVADQLQLRFDGPLPQVGAPGPFTIARLQIRIGVTAVATPTAAFAGNLTQPLTTVFDGPVTYLPDNGVQFPHPWGGPNGTLTFPFLTAVSLALAPGQWLVVDLAMEGNDIASFGFAHAILDGAPTTGGLTNGTAASFGAGCSAAPGAPTATAAANGLFGPGGAHFLAGANLGTNTLALAAFGLSNTQAFAPLPFQLPGTACALLVSPDVTVPTTTNAAGNVAGDAAVALALPADPALSGLVLYEQFAALAPAANAFGLALSNGVAVTLGAFAPAGRGTWLVSHDTSATAAYATAVRAFGMALRLRTL